ncbi:MFS transporter [Pokkaliibacter sp. MBI-7]|uniref:MFS transporter n=1 Tax=Pokkaliibacter sp. MBI-7 TaxID=3040600 RepID=UPI002447F155|nr:MFS transporter [Pokkaliibacter sp. MBI-7]MDH2435239.1 MFS transporter [Pokkaliibacter sp. MBI-7]
MEPSPSSDRRTLLCLLVLSASYFSFNTCSLAVVGLLEPMAASMQQPTTQMARLVSLFALIFAVAAPLMQVVSSGRSRRRMLQYGLLAMAAGALGSAFSPDYDWLLVARGVLAVGAAIVGPTALAVSTLLVAPAHQGRALAIVFTGMTLSTVFGVPLASWLGTVWSWQGVFMLMAAVIVLCGVLVSVLLQDHTPAPRVTAKAFLSVFQRADTGWSIVSMLMQMASQFASYTLISILLVRHFQLPEHSLAAALMAFGVGGVMGNALSGALAERFSPDQLLWTALIGMMVTFSLFILAPAMPWAGITLTGIWAVFGLMFQTPQQRRLISLAPNLRGLLLAMNASAIYFGMSLGSTLGSFAFHQWGDGSMSVASLLLAIASAAGLWLSQRAASASHQRENASTCVLSAGNPLSACKESA